MTTFMLEEIDWSTRHIKVSKALILFPLTNLFSLKTSVSVCHDMASHPEKLTDQGRIFSIFHLFSA